jgi:hypothetical protein
MTFQNDRWVPVDRRSTRGHPELGLIVPKYVIDTYRSSDSRSTMIDCLPGSRKLRPQQHGAVVLFPKSTKIQLM